MQCIGVFFVFLAFKESEQLQVGKNTRLRENTQKCWLSGTFPKPFPGYRGYFCLRVNFLL